MIDANESIKIHRERGGAIYFVRHGQTDDDLTEQAGKVVSENDMPLNDTGIMQAQKIAKTLRNSKIDIILTSPYKKAVQTAEIINKYHNVLVLTELELRKREGTVKYKKSWRETFDVNRKPSPNGESVGDFFTRIGTVIDKIKKEHNGKNVLIVSHGSVGHGFYVYFNNLSWKSNSQFDPLDNCDFRKYQFNN